MTAVPPPGLVQPDAWFIACTSAQLRAAPLAVTVQGRPLVLFRARGGAPTGRRADVVEALALACPAV